MATEPTFISSTFGTIDSYTPQTSRFSSLSLSCLLSIVLYCVTSDVHWLTLQFPKLYN